MGSRRHGTRNAGCGSGSLGSGPAPPVLTSHPQCVAEPRHHFVVEGGGGFEVRLERDDFWKALSIGLGTQQAAGNGSHRCGHVLSGLLPWAPLPGHPFMLFFRVLKHEDSYQGQRDWHVTLPKAEDREVLPGYRLACSSGGQ